MKPALILSSTAAPGISLESIRPEHLELLRLWKNNHSHRFFHQEKITAAQQHQWFDAYATRPLDWIFLIHDAGTQHPAGCLGYRVLDAEIDIYNVLRAEDVPSRSRAHSHALNILTNHIAATHQLPIRARVLADNPAARWARLHGFQPIGRGHEAGLEYHFLEQDPLRRAAYPVAVKWASDCTNQNPL